MKERTIIFTGGSVPAIIDGRKTQTRRVVKFRDGIDGHRQMNHVEYARDGMPIFWGGKPVSQSIRDSEYYDRGMPCPYGVPGDRLWVREGWAYCQTIHTDCGDEFFDEPPLSHVGDRRWVYYRADDDAKLDRWRSPLHMPRWASRLTLEVVSVRAERLQSITAFDALNEGIRLPDVPGIHTEECRFPESFASWTDDKKNEWFRGMARQIYHARCIDADNHIVEFGRIWDRLNSKRGYPWKSNPWVWVVEFKKI